MTFSKYGYLLLFACLIFVSCQDSNLGVNSRAHQTVSPKRQASALSAGHNQFSNQHIVSKQVAKQVALHFANGYRFKMTNLMEGHVIHNSKKTTGRRFKKEIKTALVLRGTSKKPLLYLINFKKRGFVIVSGDKQLNPILAYSRFNKFPTNKKGSLPVGLSLWLQHSTTVIKKIRHSKNNSKVKVFAEKDNSVKSSMWKLLMPCQPIEPATSQGSSLHPNWKKCIPDDPPGGPNPPGGGGGECQPNPIQLGPLLQTTWGQGYGFNNYAPYMACSTINGRAKAGCVATAMAQVMNYYQYPSGFNWNVIPDAGNYGNDAVSHLMHDIGLHVDMHYGCVVSFTTPGHIVPSLHQYGYTAQKIDFNSLQVMNQLNKGRPVILSAVGDSLGGHVWVTGGYIKTTPCPGVWTSHVLYMNWGWYGRANGWYLLFKSEKYNFNFNHHKKAIINIYPEY